MFLCRSLLMAEGKAERMEGKFAQRAGAKHRRDYTKIEEKSLTTGLMKCIILERLFLISRRGCRELLQEPDACACRLF
jgi:hypothetical protein